MALKVRSARTYADPKAATRRLWEAAYRPVVRDLKGSLKHLSVMVPQRAAEYKIKIGAFEQVKDVIRWQHFREVLKAPFGRIGDLRYEAGGLGVRKINGAFNSKQRQVRFGKHIGTLDRLFDQDVEKDIGGRFNFDRFDTPTLDRIRAEQDRLIQQLTAEARNTIDGIVIAGVQSGLSPAEIVDDVRDMIGLTDRQMQAVMNYRSMLQGLDGQALQRQLRNTALDADVLAAIDSGTPLDEVFIDQATQNYLDNYLDYRAGTIAQTEVVRAATAGLHDAYMQAIDRGALPDDAVKRFWRVSLDEKTCPICLSIPDQNPDGVGVGEEFQSIDGAVMDSPVHPNCRCDVEYVTDLDKVPEDDEFEKYSPDQPRDDDGRWSDGGGSQSGSGGAGAGGGGSGPHVPGIKADTLAGADSVKSEWEKDAPSSVDRIMSLSSGNQQRLGASARRLAAQTGAKFKDPGPKGRPRIEQKIAGGRSPQSITDAVRGGFVVDNPSEADHIIRGLGKDFAVADEGWQSTPAGYFDRKAIVRFADGQTGELQFWHPAMLAAKESGGGHKLYEEARALKIDDPRRGVLEGQMRELYGKVTSSLSTSWRSVVGRS